MCHLPGGCTHTDLPDWTPCGEGMVCDGSGACKTVWESKGMAFVPAGTFWMGCNKAKDSQCDDDEKPQHKVTLSAYYMDITETTGAQWMACVEAGGCTAPDGDRYEFSCNWDTTNGQAKRGRELHPVNCVTWIQAQQYCVWRGAGFDLPTEAQWEMAARGSCEENGSAAGDPACAKAMRTYPWGEAKATCDYAVMDNGNGTGCGKEGTLAVGSIPAGDRPYGLHDMAGNVWEWTRDWFAFYTAADQTDPVGPSSGRGRVHRGGDFGSGPTPMRAGSRLGKLVLPVLPAFGMRCVRAYP